MTETKIVKIDLNEKYLMIFKNVEAQELERVSLDIKEWLDGDFPFLAIAVHGKCDVELVRVGDNGQAQNTQTKTKIRS